MHSRARNLCTYAGITEAKEPMGLGNVNVYDELKP